MLIFVILISGGTPTQVGPLFVALLVVGIGASLGGPTGYAINPARDLGPRIAHAMLPIKGKGSSDWGYSWVPVVAPIVGAVAGHPAVPGHRRAGPDRPRSPAAAGPVSIRTAPRHRSARTDPEENRR